MAAWSASKDGYRFGPYGPRLPDLRPGVRFIRVLDLGCGNGANTACLSTVADEVWGVDADQIAIQHAQRVHPSIHFLADSAENFLRSTSLTFDCVVCARLLGFIPDLHALFSPLHGRVRGLFVLSDWHPMACWVWPDGLMGMDYSAEGAFAPGQYHHTIASITNALIECGFTVLQMVEGPVRRMDPEYRGAPQSVLGLPLTMTWVCTSSDPGGTR